MTKGEEMKVIRIPVTNKVVAGDVLDQHRQGAAQRIQDELATIIQAKPGKREQLWKKTGPRLVRTLRSVLGESQLAYSKRFNIHQRTMSDIERGQYLHNLPIHDFAKKFSEIKRSEIDKSMHPVVKERLGADRKAAARKAAETRRQNQIAADQPADEYIKEQATQMAQRMVPNVKKPITVSVRGIEISGEAFDVAAFMRELGVFEK
jgi:DNA-binding XRE family transcriptional regulator